MPKEPDERLSVVEEALARLAILEDVGEGDVTAALVPATLAGLGLVRSKTNGVLSGTGVARAVFRAVDPTIGLEFRRHDGDYVFPGTLILIARGSARSLLTAERSVLNFLQHLSGIATGTARFVDAVHAAGSNARITDTRKTTPGLRLLEKEAVLHGGGFNHRLGLYDAIMIKDNHLLAAGGIAAAVATARAGNPPVPIIVEARSREEAVEAARLNVGRILLDNMKPAAVADCVGAIRGIETSLPKTEDPALRYLPDTWRSGDGWIQVEVSGGITLANAASFALPDVDFLAVGEITHSAPAIDISMDLELPGR